MKDFLSGGAFGDKRPFLDFTPQTIISFLFEQGLLNGLEYLSDKVTRQRAQEKLAEIIHGSQQLLLAQSEQYLQEAERKFKLKIARVNSGFGVPYSEAVRSGLMYIAGEASNNVAVVIAHPEYGIATANYLINTPEYAAHVMLLVLEHMLVQAPTEAVDRLLKNALFGAYITQLRAVAEAALEHAFMQYTSLVSPDACMQEELRPSAEGAHLIVAVNDQHSLEHCRSGAVDPDNLTRPQNSILQAIVEPINAGVSTHAPSLGTWFSGRESGAKTTFHLGTEKSIMATTRSENNGRPRIETGTVVLNERRTSYRPNSYSSN